MTQAHEIRNALTSTRLIAEMLSRHEDPMMQGFSEALEKSSARIVAAVEKIEAMEPKQ